MRRGRTLRDNFSRQAEAARKRAARVRPDQVGPVPISNATARGVYDGAELRPYAGRPGAMRAFDLPSRVEARRYYRDGRIEIIERAPDAPTS